MKNRLGVFALLAPLAFSLSACGKPPVVETYDSYRLQFGVSDKYERDEEYLTETVPFQCSLINPDRGAWVDTSLTNDMDFLGSMAAAFATVCPDKAAVFLEAQAKMVRFHPDLAAPIIKMHEALPDR